MSRIDESRPFVPVTIAVLTVSDTRTPANDTSGDVWRSGSRAPGTGRDRAIERDDAGAIEAVLRRWIADPRSMSSSPPAAPASPVVT